MKYIYMNEFISGKNEADVPVIVVLDGESKRLVYCNEVAIKDRHGSVVARVRFGTPPKFFPHAAKAWVEIYEFGSTPYITTELFK